MGRIHGRHYLKYLQDNGIIPPYTRRVVIDASVDSAVTLYCETFGSDELLKLDPAPLADAGVRWVNGVAEVTAAGGCTCSPA